jgi:flagella synthesis protein FlgN
VSASPLAQLGAELAKVREFLALLEREQTLLTRADTEALLPLIDTKSALSSELAEFSLARESHLQALQLPPGRTGVQAWLDRNGSPIERNSWQELLGLAAKVRVLNETNGKLITLHMQKNQQAFNALMMAANRAMTYGPDGQQQTALGGRILGTA